MEEDKFIISTMLWSFSRLSFFHQCPYGFKLKYINCIEGEKNFFSEYGSFMHTILEKYEKGEMSLFEISQYYEEHFNEEIIHDAPPNNYVDLRQSYYNKGLDYLNNIDLILDGYEILGIEKEVKFKINGYEVIGYIDLLLRDKKTGDIIVLDHKSQSIRFNKNGSVNKQNEKDVLKFKRQLYLYSIPIIEEYGIKPKYLRWNLFKDRNWLNVEFDDKEFEEAKQWAEDTVKAIENETEWLPKPSQFFCQHLCDMRKLCM